jgi:hypothetical protein
MRAEDRRTISCWRLAVALPHSAISPSVRPQPVQTLALVSSLQISLHGDGGRSVIDRPKHAHILHARRVLVLHFCIWQTARANRLVVGV